MAAKSQHVHDSCVVERRLRPIYDWLDVGNNKKALQEIEKVLKKSPSLQCARALRCLAAWRLGREREALQMLDALAEESPADDATLQVMTICYRESQQLERVCPLYEAAVQKDPANEELHTHLFMSYVRVGDLERQQQSAMRLYRNRPKNPYYFWAVMSIVLQATRGSGSADPVRRGVLLELAQRMVDRLAGTDGRGLEAEQELRLYLRVLRLRGQEERALAVLAGPLGTRLLPGAWPAAALPLLRRLQRWRRLNRLARAQLQTAPDRWDTHLLYLDSAFRLMAGEGEREGENAEGEEGDADDTPERCAAFLVSELPAEEGGRPLRGPYLARLELFKRLRAQDKDAEGLLGTAEDLLLQYFRQFSHKPCCASDLRPYLSLVSPEELGSRLSACLHEDLHLPPHSEEAALQRAVSCAQLCACCGLERELPPAPAQPCPALALLAARRRLAEASRERCSAPLLEALHGLHAALVLSPSDYHCKLLAIKLYHILGCGLGAHTVHESLDVKHVQLDSLCHIHCSQLGRTGLLGLAREAYITTVKFFSHSYKDSVDHLTFSYKFGSFMKLEELMDWRERLYRSLHHAWCSIEGSHLALLGACSTAQVTAALLAAPAPPAWDLLTDNRDPGVSAHWGPEEGENASAEQFRQDRAYLRLRSLLLEGLRAGQQPVGGEAAGAERLRELMGELEVLTKDLRAEIPASTSGMLPSRLTGLLVPPLLEACCAGLGCIAGGGGEEERCAGLLRECYTLTSAALQRQADSADPLWTHRETMETVVNILEVVSVLCAVCGQCWEAAGRSKGGRKKGGAPGPLSLALQEVLGGLGISLQAWELPTALEGLALGPAPPSPLAEGHSRAVTTLTQALKDKTKFLSTLT